MSNYRRYFVPGGSYFFTVVTYRRAPFLCTPKAREILRTKLRECRSKWPFEINAFVLMPDHLHTIWSLPPGDSAFSRRWGWIKKEFTSDWLAAGGSQQLVSAAKRRRRRRGVWQPRFWEHLLDDEDDFERHFDYIHYNPVKHKCVARPRDWLYSSFHRWAEKGVYPPDWGSGPMDFDDLDDTAAE